MPREGRPGTGVHGASRGAAQKGSGGEDGVIPGGGASEGRDSGRPGSLGAGLWKGGAPTGRGRRGLAVSRLDARRTMDTEGAEVPEGDRASVSQRHTRGAESLSPHILPGAPWTRHTYLSRAPSAQSCPCSPARMGTGCGGAQRAPPPAPEAPPLSRAGAVCAGRPQKTPPTAACAGAVCTFWPHPRRPPWTCAGAVRTRRVWRVRTRL